MKNNIFTQHSLLKTLLITIFTLTLGVGEMWGISEGSNWNDASNAKVFFDNTKSGYTYVSLLIGRQWSYNDTGDKIGSSGINLSKIDNTLLYYATVSYNKYNTMCFINATNWGWEENRVTSRATYAANYTNTSNDNLGSNYHLYIPASGSNNANLTHQTLTNSQSLNYTQTIKYAVSVNDGTPTELTSGDTPAKIYATSYYFAYGTSSTVSSTSATLNANTTTRSTTFDAARTATTTLTISDIQDGYTFDGWYTAESGGEPLSPNATNTTCTYNPTSVQTIYARFSKQETHNIIVKNNVNNSTETYKVGETSSTSITAQEISNYIFDHWDAMPQGVTIKSGNVNTSTISITATTNATLTANYTEDLSTNWYLTGDFNDWDQENHPFNKNIGENTGEIAYTYFYLTPSTEKDANNIIGLKVIDKSTSIAKWYGNNPNYPYTKTNDGTSWTLSDNWNGDSYNNNMKLDVSEEGEYIFELNYSSTTEPTLAIHYPVLTISATEAVGINSPLSFTIALSDAGKRIFSNDYKIGFEIATENNEDWNGPDKDYSAEFSESTLTGSLSFNNAGFYRIRAVLTDNKGNQHYSKPANFIVYTAYQVTIKTNSTTKNWIKNVFAWREKNNIAEKDTWITTTRNAEWPGEELSTAATLVKNDNEGSEWLYEFYYPLYNNFIINDGKTYNKNEDKYQTEDIQITSNTCITIIDGNGSNDDAKWNTKKDDNCRQDYYRIRSNVGNNTYYSNIVADESNDVSFYASKDGNIVVEHWTATGWTTTSAQPIKPSESGVFVTTINASHNGLNTLQPYEGDYKLFSQAVANSKNHSEAMDSTFIYFAEGNKAYMADGMDYNYYWVDWTLANNVKYVRASVGNNINSHITNEIVYDEIYKDDNDFEINNGSVADNNKANIRYAYNPRTNFFSRACLGAGGTLGQRALVAYDQNGKTDFAGHYIEKTNTDYSKKYFTIQSYDDIKEENGFAGEFSDLGNWVYEIDVEATGNSKVIVLSKFNGVDEYLSGVDAQGPQEINLINDDIEEVEHTMRILYNFKTGHLISAWIPDATKTIEGEEQLGASMMVVRGSSVNGSLINLGEGAQVSDIDKVYTVIEIAYDDLPTLQAQGNFIWFSLPYKCKISDIFGMSLTDYKKKWEIQRYRGDLRAQNGYLQESQTFWRILATTATLEAGRGYVLRLDINESDFHDKGDKIRLYFPSNTTDNLTLTNSSFEYTAPENVCKINGREEEDSNWNIIGVPSWQNVELSAGDMSSTTFDFLYEWSWENNEGVYKAASSNSYKFFPTTAYMLQWHGIITWTSIPTTIVDQQPATVRANAPATRANREVCLSLSDTTLLDRTYVSLTDKGTDGYDLGHDLSKILSTNTTQIYTRIDGYDMAGDTRPLRSVNVSVVVKAAKDGEYTFSVNDNLNGVIPVLYDRTEDRYANLLFGSYTAYINKGTISNRFELQLEYEEVLTPSSNENISNEGNFNISLVGDKMIISGIDDGSTLYLYDAAGRLIQHSTALQNNTSLPTPQPGIYLININGTTQKIVVK